MSISAVVIAKNSASTIVKTLSSVQFADEVILVDIKSTDLTKDKAAKYCSKILDYKEDSRFVEPVRKFALAQATKDWILVLDADEEVVPSLAKELQKIDQKDLGDVYYLPRKNIFSGFCMEHTGWWPDYQLRFFKNGLVSWGEQIHAQPVIEHGYKAQILAAKSDLALLHHNYVDTKDYLTRFDRYTDIEAEQKSKTKGFVLSQSKLLKAFSDDFLRRFFAKEGYKDGARGLYLSLMQAVYQMTVQMKIFDQLGKHPSLEKNQRLELLKDLRHFQKELNYWVRDLESKEKKGLSKIVALCKRKLNL
jgi:glycosyltransferase involved in cell wall biosynthesis